MTTETTTDVPAAAGGGNVAARLARLRAVAAAEAAAGDGTPLAEHGQLCGGYIDGRMVHIHLDADGTLVIDVETEYTDRPKPIVVVHNDEEVWTGATPVHPEPAHGDEGQPAMTTGDPPAPTADQAPVAARARPAQGWATYGWIVTRDVLAEDPEHAAGSSVGVMGPRTIDPAIEARLIAGEGRRWRTLFDVDYDGHPREERVAHEGRYLECDEDDLDGRDQRDAGGEGFAPLWDFSQPDSGAVEIEYYTEAGEWETL